MLHIPFALWGKSLKPSQSARSGPSWRRITVLVLVAFALVVVLGAVLTLKG
jgi:hypothetical protein